MCDEEFTEKSYLLRDLNMLATFAQTEPRLQSRGTIHEHLYLATGRHTRQVSFLYCYGHGSYKTLNVL